MGSTDESYLSTGYEPKNYDLMETYVESLTESLTQPQFPEQRFLEDLDYDDTLEEMLHNAHREHVYHSQREGLSVGQSSSSVSERTGRFAVERGQELNSEHAQIRTLLDRQKEQILAECQAEIKKHEFQANYDRRSIQKLSEIIESQQEELHCAQAEELQRRDQQLLHAQLQESWRLAVSTTSSGHASSPTYKQNQQQSLDGLGSVPHMRRIPGHLNLSRARLAAPPKLSGDMTHAFMQFGLG